MWARCQLVCSSLELYFVLVVKGPLFNGPLVVALETCKVLSQ